jgi:hypothetical protein
MSGPNSFSQHEILSPPSEPSAATWLWVVLVGPAYGSNGRALTLHLIQNIGQVKLCNCKARR